MRHFIPIIFFLISCNSFSQNNFSCIVKDSLTGEPLPFVNVSIESTKNRATTDAHGNATLVNVPNGGNTILVSFVGYKIIKQTINFPLNEQGPYLFLLPPDNQTLDEVIIATTRTNSRIEDLNTKVEVLGQEDMDEESTIVPGTVTSILGDLSIITIQKTNPVNGNEAIRMQGLDSRYTQIMRDGLPLYGGFSGSLGVLSIPPLDLKQVEIIKGSASTLYGGGAIGGLINLISKEPVDSSQAVLTVNGTSLREYNGNVFLSQRKNKLGLTLFGGVNMKSPNDINGDGFAEVPEQKNFSIHPRLFYDFNKNNKLIIGLSTVYDARLGGDIHAIEQGIDSIHTFLQEEKVFRNTLDLTYNGKLNPNHLLTFKSAGSFFRRALSYSGFNFTGTQYSTYSEVNDFFKVKKHTLVFGSNVTSESFFVDRSDSVLFGNYAIYTVGFFVQDDWQLAQKMSLQMGLRYDYNNRYRDFILPRLAVLYKANAALSIRLSGGTGYKTPSLFDHTDPSPHLLDINSSVNSEKSYGINSDINYHTSLFDAVGVQLNQAFYYTRIDNSLILSTNTAGNYFIENGNYLVNSYGTDTYIRLFYEEFELYIGYNHTESLKEGSNATINMPFNPKDKFSGTFTYEIESEWRIGLEGSRVSNQYIGTNQKVNNYWFFAAMVERKFKHLSFILNCENLLDARQSKFQPIVTGTLANPVFQPLWAPLEGRVFNLCIKLTL
ncbi:MAG TPA: TonB-dependent receptor [Bacteroidia bacterium]|nr:TonB-dependent receptor [Bacteroidia bacterium]